jgi:iron complex outermembrane receptor protein
VARQSRVDPRADVAPAPAGYALLGASASVGLRQGAALWRVQVEGRNLLNARYREYTSLMRYYANQPGRDLLVRLSTSW